MVSEGAPGRLGHQFILGDTIESRYVVWWWGQVGISDAGPAKGIKIYEQNNAKIDAKSLKIEPAPQRRSRSVP